MGFDARTGKRLWVFHTIARKGEAGGDSWTDEAREYTGNTGVWAPISADVERGLVYLPVEDADQRFLRRPPAGQQPLQQQSACAWTRAPASESWHFQLVHHDILDYDTPTAPVLLDVTVKRQTHSRPWRR